MNLDHILHVGQADKYSVTSGNCVFAHFDFWNDYISNIQDQTIQGMVFLNGLKGTLI